MKVKRIAQAKLLQFAEQYPIVTLTGPRQSGKSTLCKMSFPEHKYVSLEDLDNRLFAEEDPRGFLKTYSSKTIIDEFQRVPSLASYLQTHVDTHPEAGNYILTGSQNLQISNAINQSLAGRTALLHLLPFSLKEVREVDESIGLNEVLFRGGYPRIYDQNLSADEFLRFYINTYIERDIRQLSQILDLDRFTLFVKLCAGRSASLLNISSLANDAGVSVNTAKNWLSLLEASFIVKRLSPWHANLGKRLTKSPKLYFLDVGLCCHLLGIQSAEQIQTHPLRGNLFETFILSEAWKSKFNQGKSADYYFYRDSNHNEIDLLEETPRGLKLSEIKSGATLVSDWFKVLKWAKTHLGGVEDLSLIYGGEMSRIQNGIQIYSWDSLTKF